MPNMLNNHVTILKALMNDAKDRSSAYRMGIQGYVEKTPNPFQIATAKFDAFELGYTHAPALIKAI